MCVCMEEGGGQRRGTNGGGDGGGEEGKSNVGRFVKSKQANLSYCFHSCLGFP